MYVEVNRKFPLRMLQLQRLLVFQMETLRKARMANTGHWTLKLDLCLQNTQVYRCFLEVNLLP